MARQPASKTSRTTYRPAGGASGPSPLDVHPATPARFADLETLFGKRGAYSGCWCMYWRISAAEFASNGNSGNHRALKEITDSGAIPGLIGYRGKVPVGWISVAPREQFGRLLRSPKLKPIDAEPVWSIVCFFVHREHRRGGVAQGLLEGAIAYAASRGASTLEAYPHEYGPGEKPDPAVYMGTTALFTRAGFLEVARRSARRPILRLPL